MTSGRWLTAGGVAWFGFACYGIALGVAAGLACGLLGTCTPAEEAAGERWAVFGSVSFPLAVILAAIGVYRWGKGRSMRRSATGTPANVHRTRGRRAVLFGIAVPLFLWLAFMVASIVLDSMV